MTFVTFQDGNSDMEKEKYVTKNIRQKFYLHFISFVFRYIGERAQHNLLAMSTEEGTYAPLF